jgi:GNAT superfamily N-acetyltransferase
MVFEQASLSNEGDRDALLANPDLLALDHKALWAGHCRVAADTTEPVGVIGFATITVEDAVAELVDLFVDPAWMRQGVATSLVSDLADRARACGCGRIEVDANDHAMAFYLSAGFEVIGTTETALRQAPRMALVL